MWFEKDIQFFCIFHFLQLLLYGKKLLYINFYIFSIRVKALILVSEEYEIYNIERKSRKEDIVENIKQLKKI